MCSISIAFWVALFTNPGAFIISVMKRQSIEMEDRERQRMERAERAEKERCSEAAAGKRESREEESAEAEN